MEKKDLKMYEAPAVEVVEMETAGVMLAGSDTGTEWDPEPSPWH